MSVLFDTAFRMLNQATEQPDERVRSSLEVPQDTEYGDVYSDLPLAISHENATKRASEIEAAIDDTAEPLAVSSSGPYVNFSICDEEYYDRVVKGFNFSPRDTDGGSVLIETAPPNIGDGYVPLLYRGLCVWDALSGIGSHLGYDVEQLLFWNDCGEPAGAVLAGRATEGTLPEAISTAQPGGEDTDPTAGGAADVLAARLESEADGKLHDCWDAVRSEHRRELLAYLDEHGFRWDRLIRESDTWERLDNLREQLLNTRFVEVDDDGSVLVRFPGEELPPRIAFRSDGASVYFVRDLAELQRRMRREYDHCLYVVSSNQKTHLKQLFTTARALEFPDVDRCEHVAYGLVDGDSQTLERFFEGVGKFLVEDGPSFIGDSPGAVRSLSRLYFLNRTRVREMEAFGTNVVEAVVEEPLSLLYCRSRARTLVRRAREAGGATGGVEAYELRSEERALLKRLDRRWDVLEKCFRRRDPHPFVRYLYLLAADFNAFYQNCPVVLNGRSHPVRRPLCALTVELVETAFDILRLPSWSESNGGD